MRNQLQGEVTRIPISFQFNDLSDLSCSNGIVLLTQNKDDIVNHSMNRHGKKVDTFVHGVQEHVRIWSKISETVRGKLRLGARILQLGGAKRVFEQIFRGGKGEKLLKASQCNLSTTAGPIAGLLFISTQRVAFCSERLIKFSSPNGELVRFHYKVSIPLKKIQRANQSENVKAITEIQGNSHCG